MLNPVLAAKLNRKLKIVDTNGVSNSLTTIKSISIKAKFTFVYFSTGEKYAQAQQFRIPISCNKIWNQKVIRKPSQWLRTSGLLINDKQNYSME